MNGFRISHLVMCFTGWRFSGYGTNARTRSPEQLRGEKGGLVSGRKQKKNQEDPTQRPILSVDYLSMCLTKKKKVKHLRLVQMTQHLKHQLDVCRCTATLRKCPRIQTRHHVISGCIYLGVCPSYLHGLLALYAISARRDRQLEVAQGFPKYFGEFLPSQVGFFTNDNGWVCNLFDEISDNHVHFTRLKRPSKDGRVRGGYDYTMRVHGNQTQNWPLLEVYQNRQKNFSNKRMDVKGKIFYLFYRKRFVLQQCGIHRV